jgi:sigma-B regulation protein RsbU (phosphoserine phosphatase)
MQLKQEDLKNNDILNGEENLIHCGTPIISGNENLEALLFTSEKLSESVYNHDDLELLNLFAENMSTAFERARLYEEMAEKQRLQRELEIAREIQINSLPKCEPDYAGLQICASLTAATEVGGDYYDYLEFSQNQLGIIVGDVVGKGTSGAFYMSKIQGFLQTMQIENLSPRQMFERLNTLIRNKFEHDFFFTALYGTFDIKLRSAELYRLGHNGLYYFSSAEKKVHILEPEGIAFGMAETEKFIAELKTKTVDYQTGDLFVFLTDGFLEAMNEDFIPFGEQKICQIIAEHASSSASEIMEALEGAIKEYTGGVPNDDATGINILPG